MAVSSSSPNPRQLLLARAVGDADALTDPERADAYLPLGDIDLAWLDALTAAVHEVTGRGPATFWAALRLHPRRGPRFARTSGLEPPAALSP